MRNAADRSAASPACLPAAYEVSCRIRAGCPRGFWPHSPRTVASRHSTGSPAPRRRGFGKQAAATSAAPLSLGPPRAMSSKMSSGLRGCEVAGSLSGSLETILVRMGRPVWQRQSCRQACSVLRNTVPDSGSVEPNLGSLVPNLGSLVPDLGPWCRTPAPWCRTSAPWCRTSAPWRRTPAPWCRPAEHPFAASFRRECPHPTCVIVPRRSRSTPAEP